MQFKQFDKSQLGFNYRFMPQVDENTFIYFVAENFELDEFEKLEQELEQKYGQGGEGGQWIDWLERRTTERKDYLELQPDGTWVVAASIGDDPTYRLEIVFRTQADAALFKLGYNVK